MPFTEILSRFAIAAVLTTCFCVPLGLALLRITGVPPTYPPLLPQQILSGTIGGALLISLGYWLLCALIPNKSTRHTVFLALTIVLCLASFQLATRLSYTQSPRFAGVTIAAQVGQCVLHVMVVFISVICFLSDESGWS